MPRPVPTIAPLAVSYIRKHGPQTADALSRALGFGVASTRKALSNAVDCGHISVVKEALSTGGYCFYYGLVKKVVIPRLTAGEWCGYRATGTRPSSIRRLVLILEADGTLAKDARHLVQQVQA